MNWPGPDQFKTWQEWASAFSGVAAHFEQLVAQQQPIAVGTIGEFLVLPPGWLPATGQTISPTAFPALVAKLGSNVLPTLTPQYNPAFTVGVKA